MVGHREGSHAYAAAYLRGDDNGSPVKVTSACLCKDQLLPRLEMDDVIDLEGEESHFEKDDEDYYAGEDDTDDWVARIVYDHGL